MPAKVFNKLQNPDSLPLKTGLVVKLLCVDHELGERLLYTLFLALSASCCKPGGGGEDGG